MHHIREYIYTENTGFRDLIYRLTRYIGYGYGSTPSYDDYLSGILYGLNMLFGLNPSQYLEHIRGRTTLISFYALKYMSEGYAPKPLNDLACVILDPMHISRDIIYDVLLDILSIGGSSGYYMGLGLLKTIQLISQNRKLLIYRKLIHHP